MRAGADDRPSTGLARRLSLAAAGAYGLSAAACAALIALTHPGTGGTGWGHDAASLEWKILALQMGIVVIGLLLPTVWLQRMLAQRLGEPLQLLQASLHRMAQGDLTQPGRVTGDPQLARVLQEAEGLRERLGAMVSTLRRAAASISAASSEIAGGNADLSGRTEQAASSLEETASSMEELTGAVRQVAVSAATAHGLASSSTQLAVQGGAMVDQAVATMQDIHAASRRIADIISVIDGIAFQTNILALNAAVEAARAGEQGRGFAVVAGEVRSLARRSAEAAREIKALILDSARKVESGSDLVTVAGRSMQDIVASVQQVAQIIGEVKASSAEQSLGIIQVNSAVAELDQMTQQNAALVEQSAAASESLKDQAASLARVVEAFQVEAHAPADGWITSTDGPDPARPKPVVQAIPAPARKAAAAPVIDLWDTSAPKAQSPAGSGPWTSF